MSALDRIKKQVEESPVILYMKGTPQMPMCGFSSRTVEVVLKQLTSAKQLNKTAFVYLSNLFIRVIRFLFFNACCRANSSAICLSFSFMVSSPAYGLDIRRNT